MLLSKGGAVLRALAFKQCGLGSNSGVDAIWVECVVGSLPCSERFNSGSSGLESTDTFQRILKLLNVP